jgi:hypothetical protein
MDGRKLVIHSFINNLCTNQGLFLCRFLQPLTFFTVNAIILFGFSTSAEGILLEGGEDQCLKK